MNSFSILRQVRNSISLSHMKRMNNQSRSTVGRRVKAAHTNIMYITGYIVFRKIQFSA